MHEIGFPLLGLKLNVNPIAFSIFGKDVYWYGIIIAFGLLLALVYAIKETKKYDNITPDNIYDVALYGVPSALIIARVYYVIFSLDKYDNLWDMFKIWEGGIAIYGAIIGAIISTLIYCKIKKVNWKDIFDICAPGLLIGQAIGRWGNFVNQEAYGYETTSPFRMEIIEAGKLIGVHPTFLYESLWNAVGLIIILFIKKYKKFSGEIFLWYVMWYGTGRAWIEGLRTDSLTSGSLRVSQLLSILIVLASIIIWILIRRKKEDII